MEEGQNKRPIDSFSGTPDRSPRSQVQPEVRSRTIPDENNSGRVQPLPEQQAFPKTVSLEIKLPKIRLPKLSRRHVYVLAATVLGLLIIAGSAKGVQRLLRKNSSQTTANGAQIKPDFKALVPKGKPDIAKVQGAQSTYDPSKHVLSYADTMNGIQLTISQQPLPDTLHTDPESLSKLVSAFGPIQLVSTDKGTAYVATNAKSQVQMTVFTKDKTLVFIKAITPLSESDWTQYINALKLAN